MADVLLLALVLIFFAGSWGMVKMCAWLREDKS